MDHFYQDIQGMFRWPELYRRAVQRAPNNSRFVEVGCFKGRSTAFLAVEIINSGKWIKLFAVDLWDESRKIGCPVEEFLANMEPVKRVVTHIKMDSADAARLFAKGSVEFVWLDGNHSGLGVKRDLACWWPKLCNGGWIGGDDLIHGGVREQVEKFFGPECLPGKGNKGNWVRFQSAECFEEFSGRNMVPASGGWCWWARSKGEDWTPPGVVNR